MDLQGFSTAEIPPPKGFLPSSRGGFVYILCWVSEGLEQPFYVGQTDRVMLRMNDYSLASFAACTDFCVGEVVKYLQRARNYRIVVKYRPSEAPAREEKALIRDLLIAGVRLVNCLPRYDYRTANEAEERDAVHRFCDMLVRTQIAAS